MPKTIRELADELKVSKQTIQYHYQRLPTKNQQIDSKETTKTNKDNNELVATLIKEVEDLNELYRTSCL